MARGTGWTRGGSGVWELFLRGDLAAGRGSAQPTFASSSRLLMVSAELQKDPSFCLRRTPLISYFHCHWAGDPCEEEARIARLVPGINNGSRRTATLLSTTAKTYFILTWSKVSKHKQFLSIHELFVGRREEKEDTKRKACHLCQRNFQLLPS